MSGAAMESGAVLLEKCFSQPDHEFAASPEQIDAALVWVKHLVERQARCTQTQRQMKDYASQNDVNGWAAERRTNGQRR